MWRTTMVSDEGLKKFKELYQQKYEVMLSPEETFEKANQLLNFYRAVFREPTNIKINIKHEQKIRDKKN